MQKQHTELREKVKSLLERVQSARRAISAQRDAFLRATLQGNPFVRGELIPATVGNACMVLSAPLRRRAGAAEGKYVDDLSKSQRSIPKGLVKSTICWARLELVEQSGIWDTVAFEQALLAQRSACHKPVAGQAEFGHWFNKFLKAEAGKRPEFIDHILCWFPKTVCRWEYSRKEDGRDFQSIGRASAGQRAATMLAFLLAHGNEPLVLDQPEDDLDNHS